MVPSSFRSKRNDLLFAVRGYLNTGDKAVAGALIFVAVVAIGIEAIVYFLGP